MGDHLSPAFQQLSATNRGPLVVVATFIFLCTSFLAVFTKIWTRLTATQRLAWTDWTILVALICYIGQSIALTIAVNHGVGRHVSDLTNAQIETSSKALFASNILLPIVLGAAKASVGFLILSVQPLRPAKDGCQIFLGVVAVWTLGSVVTLAFQCDVPEPWMILAPKANQTCIAEHAMQVIGAINIATDFAVVVLAGFMVREVHIAPRRKAVIVMLFGIRIVTPPFAILGLVTSKAFYSSEPQDRTWHAVGPLIWTQVMLGVSVITACIPSIKRFFNVIQSGMSAAPVSTIEQYELSQSRSGSVVSMGQRFRARFGSLSANKSKPRGNSEDVISFGQRYSVQVEGGFKRPESMETPLAEDVQAIRQETEYEIQFEKITPRNGIT